MFVLQINLGCDEHDTQHEYQVYVITFLEFGANEALERYEQMLVDRAKSQFATSNHDESQSGTVTTSEITATTSSTVLQNAVAFTSTEQSLSQNPSSIATSESLTVSPSSSARHEPALPKPLSKIEQRRRKRRRKRDDDRTQTTTHEAHHKSMTTVFDPCMPNGYMESARVNATRGGTFTYIRKGTGVYEQCMKDVVRLLDKGALHTFRIAKSGD
jgi:hypothetical protein